LRLHRFFCSPTWQLVQCKLLGTRTQPSKIPYPTL
jgi:hypothetical protein